MIWRLFGFLFFISSVTFAQSDLDKSFTDFMNLFEHSPQVAMDQIPPKFDYRGKRVKVKARFSEGEIVSGNFFVRKVALRDQLKGSRIYPFSEVNFRNRAEDFFPRDFQLVRSAELIDKKYSQSELNKAPWSGDYWPTYRGGAAARFADRQYPRSPHFSDYYSVYQKYLPINFTSQEAVNNLSPTEKYDILVGDDSFSLTKWSFEDANRTFRENGNKIETWFGLCHGWAPASYMMDRPRSVVQYKIENFQGHDFILKFYPDDVKALSSLLWANAAPDSNFLGGRCNSKNPKKDENGRITEENCFDINPGAWHLAVTNQVANQKMGFVLDASYDYEVWNQPVLGYEISYFHPKSKKDVSNFAEAIIPIEEYSNDTFRQYRSSQARFVVGIRMALRYVVENDASHAEVNDVKNDFVRMVQYIYDLELDQNGNIIGGEWYQNVHPDFIWSVDKGSKAISIADRYLRGEWRDNVRAPSDWIKEAQRASEVGQPLGLVIEGLTSRAQKRTNLTILKNR